MDEKITCVVAWESGGSNSFGFYYPEENFFEVTKKADWIKKKAEWENNDTGTKISYIYTDFEDEIIDLGEKILEGNMEPRY